MQVYKEIIKSTGIDFFTFYATTSAEKCNHQLVVATTGAFTMTSVVIESVGKILFWKKKNTNSYLKRHLAPYTEGL